MRCIVSSRGFNGLFIYVKSRRTEFSDTGLSEVNTLEMENSHTHLVFIHKTFNSKTNISTKPQNIDF